MKIGDRVKITGGVFSGEEGIITSDSDATRAWKVKMDCKDEPLLMGEPSLEKIEENKMKEGQHVRIGAGEYEGCTGILISYNRDEGEWTVAIPISPEDKLRTYDEVVLSPVNKERKMKVGDKVEIKHGAYAGCKGKIVAPHKWNTWKVELPETEKHVTVIRRESNLILLDRDNFEVGDKVRPTKGPLQGQVLKIVSTTPAPDIWMIRTKDGHETVIREVILEPVPNSHVTGRMTEAARYQLDQITFDLQERGDITKPEAKVLRVAIQNLVNGLQNNCCELLNEFGNDLAEDVEKVAKCEE